MAIEVIFMLSLLVLLLALFIWEPIPLSFIAISVPIILVLGNTFTHINTDEALSGFSNSATITVMCMFVFGKTVQNNGIVQLLGDKFSNIAGRNEKKQIAMISLLTGTSAGFVNNTPIVAALIPMVRDLARRTKVSPSKLLIPLSYSAMLGGTVTLIGTSTNLLASQTLQRLIGYSFDLFEFTGLGIIVLIIGISYLMTFGKQLIPERINIEEKLTDEYEMRDYLTKVLIEENSVFVNKEVKEIYEVYDYDYKILRLIRDGEEFMEPLDTKTLRPNDQLIIRATYETITELVSINGIKTLPELIVDDASIEQKVKGEIMVEIVVPNYSFLVDKTLEELNFLERYDCNVLAIRRGEKLLRESLESYRFKPGDLILLLVTEDTFNRMHKNNNFIIDKKYDSEDYDSKKMIYSILTLIFFVFIVAFRLMPIVIAALATTLLIIILKLIHPKEFFDAIEWEVYFLLSGLIPLGIAIEKTGTSKYIADKILQWSHMLPTLIVLMIIYFVTAIMTNLVSNNASILIMLPIAIEVSNQLESNPIAFAIAVTFAASAAFATPMGYQTNLMVYSSGGFKFSDFLIVGGPLQILLTVIVPIIISLFWGV